MIGLYLESDRDSISLDLLALTDGTPISVLAGATGFGLPQVETEYDAGAGDGSVFRSSRVPFRDIDLPLYIQSTSTQELNEVVNLLARALTDEVRLRLVDQFGDDWTLKCRLTGGGDFSYGVDTDGEAFATTLITLRAGQPFWERTRGEIAQQSSASGATDFTLNNQGSAKAYPNFEVTGPFVDLTITGTDRRPLVLSGLVEAGKTVYIDYENASVIDSTGTSLYSRLAAAPDFSPLEPGISSMTVNVDNTSAAYLASVNQAVSNHVRNANLSQTGTNGAFVNTTGVTYYSGTNVSRASLTPAVQAVYNSAVNTDRRVNIFSQAFATGGTVDSSGGIPYFASRLAQPSGLIAIGAPLNVGSGWFAFYQEINGLTIGQTYTVSALTFAYASAFGGGSEFPNLEVRTTNDPNTGTVLATTPYSSGTFFATAARPNEVARVSLTFTATATSHFLGTVGRSTSSQGSSTTLGYAMYANPLVSTGTTYFDQTNTSGAQYTYSTNGTTGVVTRTLTTLPPITGTKILLTHRPRRHVML